MNRREALATLSSLAGATGISVTPLSAREADDAALLVLKYQGYMSQATAERIKLAFEAVLKGTRLEAVPVVVIDGDVDIELITRKVTTP